MSFPQPKPPFLRLDPPAILSPTTHPSSYPGIDAEQDRIIQGIQAKVRNLNWTMEEISRFIADRFNDKRRYQLSHDELVLLLYYLQTQA